LKPQTDSGLLPAEARQKSAIATLTETILLKEADAKPFTGLDPSQGGVRPAGNGFPPMPQASTGAVSIDSESIVLMPDGSFFIGDGYGPSFYRLSSEAPAPSAFRPPEAFTPKRGGKDHFSPNNPGPGAGEPKPPNPETGRQNNQGFEGLALTPDGKFLVVI